MIPDRRRSEYRPIFSGILFGLRHFMAVSALLLRKLDYGNFVKYWQRVFRFELDPTVEQHEKIRDSNHWTISETDLLHRNETDTMHFGKIRKGTPNIRKGVIHSSFS